MILYFSYAFTSLSNTTHDGRTGQDLAWNELNLIAGVSQGSGAASSTLASYTWMADGAKYASARADGSGYVYKGTLVFERGAAGKLSLDAALTTGGRITAQKDASTGAITGYTVHHHITDHLGSVRAVVDFAGNILETSDFLPYGSRWSQTGGSAAGTLTDAANRWRYSGKEEQAAALNPALPLIDYGARMYDPAIARWMSVDPLAEKYYPMSPYGYCANNPIIMIDPLGLEWTEKDNKITVSVNLTNSAGVSSKQLEDYKSSISSLFNSIISDVSEGEFSGNIVFYENNPDIEQVLDIGAFRDNSFGGITSQLFSSINAYEENGELRTASSLAQSAVHELFHTVRLDHPFERTQTIDTKLIQIERLSYITTADTDPNIINNIMIYSNITINGKQGTSLTKITKGQFEYIRQEIKQQEKGYGLLKGPYLDSYDSYWTDWPGTLVTK